MRLDGFDAEVQVASDFLDRLALGEKFEHFLLARREGGEAGTGRGVAQVGTESVDQMREHARADVAAAAGDIADGADKLSGRAVFEDVSARADFHGLD